MRLFRYGLGIAILFHAAFSNAESRSPFKASESIQFTNASSSKLFRVGKISEFIGILERTSIEDPVSKDIEVYEFKNMKSLQVNKGLCSEIFKSIFGTSKNTSFDLKFEDIKSFKSHGKVCQTVLHDSDKEASIKEKHLFVIIRNFSAYAFIFRYKTEPTPAQINDQSKFIESLKFSHVRTHGPVTGGT